MPILAYTKNEHSPDHPPEDIELTRAVSWVETDAFEHTPSGADVCTSNNFKIVIHLMI